jgi:hypothetical protein
MKFCYAPQCAQCNIIEAIEIRGLGSYHESAGDYTVGKNSGQ